MSRASISTPRSTRPTPTTQVAAQKTAGTGDWGLAAIGARSVWDAYGITGKGERIGVIDTGVDPSDPDLAGKIAAWHDFVNGRATPYDDGGHGTHVAGTLVGGAAGGAAIGVAPGATLVVAKALDATGVGNGSALIAAAQWMMDPDGNPATADYPTVISNSWVSPAGTDTWFLPMVRAWRALGIVPVFAAGNTGGAGTVGSPASYTESVAVGAIDENSDLAPFSSEGPITWSAVNDEGLAPGTVVAKPDFVAPGEDVMSTVPGGYAADVRHLHGDAARRRRGRAAPPGRSDADGRPGHRHASRDGGRPRRSGRRQPVRRRPDRRVRGDQVGARRASDHDARQGSSEPRQQREGHLPGRRPGRDRVPGPHRRQAVERASGPRRP